MTDAQRISQEFHDKGVVAFYSRHAEQMVVFVRDRKVKLGLGMHKHVKFTLDEVHEIARFNPTPAELFQIVEAKRAMPGSRLLDPRAMALPGFEKPREEKPK